jgi:hypothetical protein
VFGNKIKDKDCIRVAKPVKAGSKHEIIQQIKKLKPGGLSPLADSIVMIK